MRFLSGVIMGVVLSTSVVMAASAKGRDPSGFNRSEQEKRYDYSESDNSNRT